MGSRQGRRRRLVGGTASVRTSTAIVPPSWSLPAVARANTNNCSGVSIRQGSSRVLMQNRAARRLLGIVLFDRHHLVNALRELARQRIAVGSRGARGAGLHDQVTAFIGMHGEIADLGTAGNGVAAPVPLEAVSTVAAGGTLLGLVDVPLASRAQNRPGVTQNGLGRVDAGRRRERNEADGGCGKAASECRAEQFLREISIS